MNKKQKIKFWNRLIQVAAAILFISIFVIDLKGGDSVLAALFWAFLFTVSSVIIPILLYLVWWRIFTPEGREAEQRAREIYYSKKLEKKTGKRMEKNEPLEGSLKKSRIKKAGRSFWKWILLVLRASALKDAREKRIKIEILESWIKIQRDSNRGYNDKEDRNSRRTSSDESSTVGCFGGDCGDGSI